MITQLTSHYKTLASSLFILTLFINVSSHSMEAENASGFITPPATLSPRLHSSAPIAAPSNAERELPAFVLSAPVSPQETPSNHAAPHLYDKENSQSKHLTENNIPTSENASQKFDIIMSAMKKAQNKQMKKIEEKRKLKALMNMR